MDISTPLSRRRLLAAGAATAGAAALTSALPGSTYAASPRATTTVTYWDTFVTQAPWVENEIKIFEAAHPDITIQRTSQLSTAYANLLALAIKSGTQPDVFILPATPTVNDQVAQGWLAPLNKYANASWPTRFPAGSLHEGGFVFGGKIYSAPFVGSAPVILLYTNNRVFRKAGLVNADGSAKVPRTWGEMTSAAQAIVKKSGGSTYGFGFGNQAGVFLGFWIDMLARAAGAAPGLLEVGNIDYRTGRSSLSTDPGYLQAINQMLAWKKAGLIYPNAASIGDEAARAFFAQDRFGMIADGNWAIGGWQAQKFSDYTVTTLPAPTAAGPRAYYYYKPGQSSNNEFGLSAHAKNPDAAWLWLDHLYSVEAGRRWVQMGNGLSVFSQNNSARGITFKPFAEYVALSRYALPEPDPTVRNPLTSQVIIAPPATAPNSFQIISGAYTGQVSDVKAALAKVDAANNGALIAGIAKAQGQHYHVSLRDFVFPDWNLHRPYITRPSRG